MIGAYFFITILMLVYNTIRDLKTQEIDERFNYLAMGATLMLIPLLEPTILYLILLIILSGFCTVFFRRVMASGDLQALYWIFIGLGLINYYNAIKYLVALTFLFIISFATTKTLRARNKLIPGYPLLLGSYLITIFW